jgi:competence protein ComGC
MKGKRRILYNDKKSKTFNPIRIFYLIVLLIVSIWIYFIYLSPNMMKIKNIASENEIPNTVVDNSVDPINIIQNSAEVTVESTESSSNELASSVQTTDKK